MSNQNELIFRKATLQDEAQLLGMMRILAEQEPCKVAFDLNAVSATFRRFLNLPTFGGVWLLCVKQAVVGYIVLTLGFSFEFRGHDAFIDELYVEPEFRRLGYGRKAVEFIEQRAHEIGANALHLEVDHGNDSALELYRRSGYEDHDRFLMTKWL